MEKCAHFMEKMWLEETEDDTKTKNPAFNLQEGSAKLNQGNWGQIIGIRNSKRSFLILFVFMY